MNRHECDSEGYVSKYKHLKIYFTEISRMYFPAYVLGIGMKGFYFDANLQNQKYQWQFQHDCHRSQSSRLQLLPQSQGNSR